MITCTCCSKSASLRSCSLSFLALFSDVVAATTVEVKEPPLLRLFKPGLTLISEYAGYVFDVDVNRHKNDSYHGKEVCKRHYSMQLGVKVTKTLCASNTVIFNSLQCTRDLKTNGLSSLFYSTAVTQR